mmetsp:Transcript_97304/g.280068  ORF Transcript_97304/g.280068 Transcript_97304/m.280068 type:complete len:237 (+) Transcript_97304:488-1198(+)
MPHRRHPGRVLLPRGRGGRLPVGSLEELAAAGKGASAHGDLQMRRKALQVLPPRGIQGKSRQLLGMPQDLVHLCAVGADQRRRQVTARIKPGGNGAHHNTQREQPYQPARHGGRLGRPRVCVCDAALADTRRASPPHNGASGLHVCSAPRGLRSYRGRSPRRYGRSLRARRRRGARKCASGRLCPVTFAGPPTSHATVRDLAVDWNIRAQAGGSASDETDISAFVCQNSIRSGSHR